MLLDINYILCVMNRPASKGSQLSGRTLPESDQNGYWRWSTGCRSGTSRHKNGKFVPPKALRFPLRLSFFMQEDDVVAFTFSAGCKII